MRSINITTVAVIVLAIAAPASVAAQGTPRKPRPGQTVERAPAPGAPARAAGQGAQPVPVARGTAQAPGVARGAGLAQAREPGPGSTPARGPDGAHYVGIRPRGPLPGSGVEVIRGVSGANLDVERGPCIQWPGSDRGTPSANPAVVERTLVTPFARTCLRSHGGTIRIGPGSDARVVVRDGNSLLFVLDRNAGAFGSRFAPGPVTPSQR